MKSFAELAELRRSVRAYREEALPEELVLKVLDTARKAPSACNKQPWRFVVVRGEELRRKLGLAYSREWFWKAPVVVAVCVVKSEAWVRGQDGANYGMVDGAIAMDHLTLAAAEEGLGTCWIGAFDPATARSVLGLPENVDIVAMTPLGWPAENEPRRERTRRPLADSVMWERWG